MPKSIPDSCEDLAYTRQFFTITRKGHTSPTTEIGSPTLVWHVAFWPRSVKDPFGKEMARTDKAHRIKRDATVSEEFRNSRAELTKDLNDFLKRLQDRGRVPEALIEEVPFKLDVPSDWESPAKPISVLNVEAMGFTLWWPDTPPATGNMMAGRSSGRPEPTDLRVRVQAEVTADYSSITFFIDVCKPWNRPPFYSLPEAATDQFGTRRREIFEHVENIHEICAARLEAKDKQDRRLIDLDLLPEPNPICGVYTPNLKLGYTDSAVALEAAADFLYNDLWSEFCRDFNFNLCDISGTTDEVFANSRGLVMSTPGAIVKDNVLTKAPPVKKPCLTAHPGSRAFERFDGGGEGYGTSKIEPNAIVKAFMPFLRRFRSEADWRDWIACGIFDWRALYITSVGAQSEFHPFDECEFNPQTGVLSDIPAGHLPKRLKRNGADPKALAECAEYAQGREAPSMPLPLDDRPAPFRYLLLTKFEPNRKQAGRMIERINTLGDRRLYALKNWTVIQNAGVWINHFSRQLETAYDHWIDAIRQLERKRRDELVVCNQAFFAPIQPSINNLAEPDKAEAVKTLDRYRDSPRRACEELEQLANRTTAMTADWKQILDFAQEHRDKSHPDHRTIKGNYDADLASLNHHAERELIRITRGLDELGSGAVGGLPYRIARSHYYAAMFRERVNYLRVGNIETWWSYEQFSRRAMEPALKQIANVGERLEGLRERLQAVKQDILQSSIASQTEATRDNTHRLERIQEEIRRMSEETHLWRVDMVKIQTEAANNDLHTSELNKSAAEVAKAASQSYQEAAIQYKEAAILYKKATRWYTWKALGTFLIAAIGWIFYIVLRLSLN